jgi:hypothetical protein
MDATDITKYCNLMEEVKQRVFVINAFVAGAAHALYKPTTVESIYLQIRKILELIALGSLVSNRASFSPVYAEFSKYWNARLLFRDLERINPDFYPRPVVEVPSPTPGVKAHIDDRKDGFLTKDEFLKLYEKTGAVLHADNPYGSRTDYQYYEKHVESWRDAIMGLLNSHIIKLVENPNFYLIHMHEADSKVHHYTFSPKPEEKRAC